MTCYIYNAKVYKHRHACKEVKKKNAERRTEESSLHNEYVLHDHLNPYLTKFAAQGSNRTPPSIISTNRLMV